MWENTAQEAQSRNVIITDKHRLKIAARVSRKSREEKIIENFGGDYDFFRPSEGKGAFDYFCARLSKSNATAASGSRNLLQRNKARVPTARVETKLTNTYKLNHKEQTYNNII